MTRDDLYKIMAQAVGNPASGPVADALQPLADAIDEALRPATVKEKRVVEPTETREDS